MVSEDRFIGKMNHWKESLKGIDSLNFLQERKKQTLYLFNIHAETFVTDNKIRE